MPKKTGYAVGATIAVVLVGALYVMSTNSPAQSYDSVIATPQIDAFAMMAAAKNLPSEQFDAN
jgi:hypothetical protein